MSPSHLKYLDTPKITLYYTLDLSLSRVQFGDNHQTPTTSHAPTPLLSSTPVRLMMMNRTPATA
ncbi:hypothetical protein Hanom_Chr13g01205751 [Helianthus anomalus]